MSSSCTDFEGLLARAPSGEEAVLASVPEVREHLVGCPSCRRRWRGAIEAGRALRSLAVPEEPAVGFFAELESAVLGAARTLPPQRRVRRRVAAAAAAMALFSCGVFLAGRLQRPERPPLVDLEPLSIPEPFLFDPASLTMPVDANAFRGLRGRALLEQMLEESMRRQRREFGEAGESPRPHAPR
ncbi:MAG: hypothetical protein U1F36_09545 [Planctomycetota bacterium]